MTKDQAEQGIRALCRRWADLRGVARDAGSEPNFSDFWAWVSDQHREYLNFRTTTSVRFDVEAWFDQEFKQAWRN